MKFCMPHWDALRKAIDDRGLGSLISERGEEVSSKLTRELSDGPSIDTFDPLMSAHFMIMDNAMKTLSNIGSNPMILMANDPEHPEWECPICCLNWISEEHDKTCTTEDCIKKVGLRFDCWIDRAADDVVIRWKEMN